MPKGSALDGFAALYDGTGNADAVVETPITTKAVLEYELVRRCQEYGDRPHKGSPLGLFPELWPFDALKRPLVAHAEEFVRQVGAQGYVPLTDVTAFRIWGPYTEKVGAMKEWSPEEGNHTIPRHEQRKAQKVWGYRGDELAVDKGVSFLIQGRFTRKASLGSISDEGEIFV